MGERLVHVLENEGRPPVDIFESTDRNIEVFVDGISDLMIAGSAIKLNFYSAGAPSDEKRRRRDLVCRLVMTSEDYLEICEFLNEHVDAVRKAMEDQRNPKKVEAIKD